MRPPVRPQHGLDMWQGFASTFASPHNLDYALEFLGE
jgi:hypothetical protein